MTGATVTMLAFFLYCALEGTTGLWASSFLVLRHNIAAESAASMASLFYIGITAGRFLSGFISDKLGDRRMVSIGIVCVLFGTVLLFVPVEFSAVAGLVFIGLGCAPVYPGLLHQTPVRFGGRKRAGGHGYADGVRLCRQHDDARRSSASSATCSVCRFIPLSSWRLPRCSPLPCGTQTV